MPQPGNPNVLLHFYESACCLWIHFPEEVSLNNFRASDLRLTSRAFGLEPNALPKLSNLLSSMIFAPRARFELATLRLTAEGCKTLNALFGVAYDPERLKSRPSVGQLLGNRISEKRKAGDCFGSIHCKSA